MNFLKNFWMDESGQDMVEYTLLLAFVALAAGGAYVNIGRNISGIWSKATKDIQNAATAAQ